MKVKVLILVLGALCAQAIFSARADQNPDAKIIAEKYASAQTEAQRLSICIEAIDKKLICKGCSLDATNEIFGTNFTVQNKSAQAADGPFNAVISLRKPKQTSAPPPSTKPIDERATLSATAISGWRLAIKYDAYGNISSYYISNATLSTVGF